MRAINFAWRVAKEILRDPLTAIFGLGFPVVLLLLLSAIQANIPVEMFEISRLTPGIAIFGLSFMTLFSGSIVARDRESAFLQRLYATPMRAADFIIGYALPMLPIALLQTAICYGVGFILGMEFSVGVLAAMALSLIAAVFYIALGIALGSLLGVKAVGGLCGALVTNLSAWLSGVWFDLKLVGGAFEGVARALPFVHAVEITQGAVANDYSVLFPGLVIVGVYALIISLLAAILFLWQSKKG